MGKGRGHLPAMTFGGIPERAAWPTQCMSLPFRACSAHQPEVQTSLSTSSKLTPFPCRKSISFVGSVNHFQPNISPRIILHFCLIFYRDTTACTHFSIEPFSMAVGDCRSIIVTARGVTTNPTIAINHRLAPISTSIIHHLVTIRWLNGEPPRQHEKSVHGSPWRGRVRTRGTLVTVFFVWIHRATRLSPGGLRTEIYRAAIACYRKKGSPVV